MCTPDGATIFKYLELQSLGIFWILWRDHYPQ